MSNPCFELWLLLHHADCFANGISDAIRRAKALESTGTAYEKNPSSSIWQIIEQLLETT